MGSVACQVLLVLPETRETEVSQGPPPPHAQGPRERRVTWDHREHPAHRDPQAQMDSRECQVTREHWVCQETLVYKVSLVMTVLVVTQADQDCRVWTAFQVPRASPAPLAPRV